MVMIVRRWSACALLVLLAVPAYSQMLSTVPYVMGGPTAPLPRNFIEPDVGSINSSQYFSGIYISKYFSSFTSYQFRNPFPPYQDPLSRLEFPIDQWFVGLESGYRSSSLSFRCQVCTNISRDSSLKMQDSDWDDETMPFQKTIFSESKCRLNSSLLADVRAGIPNPLGLSWKIGPVLGARYEHFDFTTHDGKQMDLTGNVIDLPGDGIDFEQVFRHFYFGVAVEGMLHAERLVEWAPPIHMTIDLDYGLVKALNEDLHLLRMGERITTENTEGHCWHAAVTAAVSLRDRLRAKLQGEFKRILTTGDHRLTNPLFSIDFSFGGSQAWSEQVSLTGTLEVPF